jgi:ASC-1-like (ASCH) protein
MKLAPAPFAQIACGKKTIECRLYDEKRRMVALGDTIVFERIDDMSVTLRVRVVGLLRYRRFAMMFAHHSSQAFGGISQHELTRQLQAIYSSEQEDRYGVLGIVIELVEADGC